MLQIDSLLLNEFYKENKDFFSNARVQKIQQPTRREVVLHLRNNGESRKFYININPQFYHVCFISPETEKRRALKIPKQPPMFCMLLRKHIEGGKILKINIPEFERILELYFENYNELGDRIEECLSIELMGKHSNIVLYNTDNNVIIGCAHNIGEKKSKDRELAGGLPYIYPPKQNKKNLLKTRYDWFESTLLKSSDSIKKVINSKYFALSQALIEEITMQIGFDANKFPTDLKKEDIQKMFISLHELLSNENKQFSVSNNYDRFSCVNNLDIKYSSINTLIDDYFSRNMECYLIQNQKSILSAIVQKELKKAQNSNQSQMKQLEKKDKIELYKTKGSLLTANSYQINNYEKFVTLVDYETGNPIKIELDETKSIIENAQKYFSLYNKGKKSIQIAQEMAEKTVEDIEYFNQLLYNIEISNNFEDLDELTNEINPQKESLKIKKNKENEPNIEKRFIDDITVYIGKNSKQNDYLYSKISSADDMWFHVLNTPGAHIIAKIQNTELLKDETILKIAQLAKTFSTAKNSTKTSVVYTHRKYVKRPINTKSGFVVYKNENEIVVS